MLQKRKNFKKTVILSIFMLLLITGAYSMFNIYKEQNIHKNTTKVVNTLKQVLDISTVKYNYSNILEVKKDKSINNIKIPFTEKSFIVKYNGVINGGVKPDDIKIISNNKDEISIEIKKCQILDHYIDDENIYIYDIKNSIFNKLEIEEILEYISSSKKEYEDEIINEGFLEEIQESTKESIKSILNELGYNIVNINFK